MAAALGHEFLQPTPAKTGLALVGAAGVLAWSLIAFLRRPMLCLGALIAITAAYLGAARFFYDTTGLLLLTVPVLSALVLSGLFSLGFEYALERIDKLRTRRTLERYVSKNLVKEILENPDGYYSTLRGVRVPAQQAVPVLRQSRREAQRGGSGSGDVAKRHADIRAHLPLHRRCW